VGIMPVDILTIAFTAAISTPAVAGLLGWLGKAYLDRQLAKHNRELESLKAEYGKQLEGYKAELDTSKRLLQADIDKTILVTKVHFETEFNALKDVFAKLAELKLLFASLRPTVGLAPQGQTKEDKRVALEAMFGKFTHAYNMLLETTEFLGPFYPPEIYEAIKQCIQSANREILDLSTSGPDMFTSHWYQRGDENLTKYGEQFGIVSDRIRNRISRLTIVQNR
jgi:hypothetical protein